MPKKKTPWLLPRSAVKAIDKAKGSIKQKKKSSPDDVDDDCDGGDNYEDVGRSSSVDDDGDDDDNEDDDDDDDDGGGRGKEKDVDDDDDDDDDYDDSSGTSYGCGSYHRPESISRSLSSSSSSRSDDYYDRDGAKSGGIDKGDVGPTKPRGRGDDDDDDDDSMSSSSSSSSAASSGESSSTKYESESESTSGSESGSESLSSEDLKSEVESYSDATSRSRGTPVSSTSSYSLGEVDRRPHGLKKYLFRGGGGSMKNLSLPSLLTRGRRPSLSSSSSSSSSNDLSSSEDERDRTSSIKNQNRSAPNLGRAIMKGVGTLVSLKNKSLLRKKSSTSSAEIDFLIDNEDDGVLSTISEGNPPNVGRAVMTSVGKLLSLKSIKSQKSYHSNDSSVDDDGDDDDRGCGGGGGGGGGGVSISTLSLRNSEQNDVITANGLTPSIYDDEQASMLLHRRSSDRNIKSAGGSSIQKLDTGKGGSSTPSHPPRCRQNDEDSEEKFTDLLEKVRGQKLVSTKSFASLPPSSSVDSSASSNSVKEERHGPNKYLMGDGVNNRSLNSFGRESTSDKYLDRDDANDSPIAPNLGRAVMRGVGSLVSLKNKSLSRRSLMASNTDEVSEGGSIISSTSSAKSGSKSKKDVITAQSLNPSIYDDEQALMLQRRSLARGMHSTGSSRKMQSKGDAPPPSPSAVDGGSGRLNSDHYNENRRADLLQRDRSQNSLTRGALPPFASVVGGESGRPINDHYHEDKHTDLLQRDRSQKPLTRGDSMTIESKDQDARSKDIMVESQCGENSVFEQRLGDAQVNVSRKSEGDENDGKSKMNVQSSRFALMMAALKPTAKAESSPIEDAGTDDDHIFVAPKIVDEFGHSYRQLSVAKSLSDSESTLFSKEKQHKKEKQMLRVGRFQVPQSSVAHRKEKGNIVNQKKDQSTVVNDHDHYDDHDHGYDGNVTDDDGTHSNGSISTESSGEHQHVDPSSEDALMRQPVDEIISSEDYYDSFVESKHSLLTSINELEEYNANDDENETDSNAQENDSTSETIDSSSKKKSSTKSNLSGLNNGAIFPSPEKFALPGSLHASSDTEKKELISPCDLMRIFDDYCDSNNHHRHTPLQNSKGTNEDDYPPLSVSLDLSVLDSKWLLKSSSGFVEGKTLSTVRNGNTCG